MLFTKRLRDGVRSGEITSSVRIWMRPHVKVGGRYRMEEGEIQIDSVENIGLPDITPELARASGFLGVLDLLTVAKHGRGQTIYLIRFHYIPPARRKSRQSHPVKGKNSRKPRPRDHSQTLAEPRILYTVLAMRPSEALARHREEIRRIVSDHRSSNPRVFGSVLNGEDAEGSDLDLLIDPAPETSLMDLARIQGRLEDLMGIPVDVLTPLSLPESYRGRVLDEARPV